MQNEILTWARRPPAPDQTDSTNVLCITGAAGTGKSAVMQTLAETSSEKGELAASFFFSYRSPKRNNSKHFVATIAYQLALSNETLRGYVAAAVLRDPSVFEKDMASQMQSLVVEPLHKAIRSDPNFERTFTCRTIYIDGVDECGATPEQTSDQSSARGETMSKADAAQSLVLEVSIKACASLPLHSPFRIIFASRPERAMRAFLKSTAHSKFHIELDEKYDPDSDIRLFLSASFERIRLKYNLTPHWVTDSAVDTIVENASGQFVYAATVIRHVDGPTETPEQALQEVLSIEPVEDRHTNPFATLDALYYSIFNKCVDAQESALLIRVVTTKFPRWNDFSGPKAPLVTAATHNLLLELQPPDVERIFGRLHSLINIPKTDNEQYAFYHKSLHDFLSDRRRSNDLYFEKAAVFTRALIGFLRVSGPVTSKSAPTAVDTTVLRINLARLFVDANLEDATLVEELNKCPVDKLLSHVPENIVSLVYKIVHVREMGCRRLACSPPCRRWRRSIVQYGGGPPWVEQIMELLRHVVTGPPHQAVVRDLEFDGVLGI